MSKTLIFVLSSLLSASLFSGCSEDSNGGVAEIHWDRDTCIRCVMVISDRKNTVQVKDPQTSKVYKFDDFGCMALWFSEENISWKDKALIWVTDVDTGEWIEARNAYYTVGNVTPMAFGFSAHKTKNKIKNANETIDFNEVINRIVK